MYIANPITIYTIIVINNTCIIQVYMDPSSLVEQKGIYLATSTGGNLIDTAHNYIYMHVACMRTRFDP